MKIDSRLTFEEAVDSEAYDTVTFYYTSDKNLLRELLGDKYPEADGTTLSIECPHSHVEAGYASVQVSPFKDNEGQVEDYDWNDIDIPLEEIDALIDEALKREIER